MEILARRLLVLGALSWASSGWAAGPIMLVPNGAVEVRSGSGQWKTISGPFTITDGQQVRTSADSSAELRFVDGSRIVLGRSSQFNVDQTQSKEASFTLAAGKLRAAFAGLFSSKISIHTPTAVAAVRGTVFEVTADAHNTEVNMAEGVLEVKDNKGHQAVVTSEETVKVGDNGMEAPHQVALSDPRALDAVRPLVVAKESARDATRHMLEDLRNRELKANEAQLGKDVVDAFGRRVRLEEYLLRPSQSSFELLFLSQRSGRFDWGHLVEQFNSKIPDDISQVPAIISNTFLSQTKPANWLKYMEFYATNTIDADKETITLGDPVQINFSGYTHGGLRWYPGSIDFTQTLTGPGVPNGSRVQFDQSQTWNAGSGLFTWTQSVQATAGIDNLQPMVSVTLNPTDPVNVAAGGTISSINLPLYNATNTTTAFPSGPTKADFQQVTTYPDNSTVSVEKFLVSNDGKILDFSNPSASAFIGNGNYNVEINVKSSLFQGRDIDVLIAPEILQQKKTQTTTVSNLQL